MCKGLYQDWLTEDGLILLAGWARDGLTHEQIANNIGINVATLYRWKEKHSEICNALKKGRDLADYIVENALFRSATGFEYTETVVDHKGQEHTVTKFAQPNTTAQIFWLKNRRPDRWRDRREQTVDLAKDSAGVVLLPAREKVVVPDGEDG